MPNSISVEENHETPLSPKNLEEMIPRVVGWALLSGVQRTLTPTVFQEQETENQRSLTPTVFPEKVKPEPFTLFPSPLPVAVFQKAKSLQPHFQTLIYKAANDHDFMKSCFEGLVDVDDFIKNLWDIYETVRKEGPAQNISLLLTRNDFMMENEPDRSGRQNCKQVEINTIASGCGTVTEVHRYSLSLAGIPYTDKQLVDNNPTAGLAKGLVKAWELYENKQAVILYVVAIPEPNIPDQRCVERDIFRLNKSVKVIRRSFAQLKMQMTSGNNKELIVDGKEVAVVYYRYGYSPDHYPTAAEFKLRLDIERSRAIKCPTVAHQLIGCKKVQQALAEPGILEKFLVDPNIIEQVRSTFVGLYKLEGENSNEIIARALTTPEKFVLKPQREGGGNNLFGDSLKLFLEKIKKSPERSSWILMDRINPVKHRNRMIREGLSPEIRTVVSELGILGAHLSTPDKEIENFECGYMMRTKPENADEGGIFHGSACLDSVFLVESDFNE